jgi:hypothetical protein
MTWLGARAGWGVWLALVLLAAARALAAIPHSMWLWGLNAPRFLSAALAWGAFAALLLTLAPPVGAALERPLAMTGARLARSLWLRLAVAALAGVLVWSLPDRTWFLGDFMLRQGAALGESKATMFQQALPLDFLVHGLGPRTMPADVLTGSVYSRLLGALEASLLALLAWRFARGLGLEGAAALAAAGIVFFGGHLAFFTGFAKPASELVLFAIATIVFGAALAREGKTGYALGLTLTLAFGFHRLSLILIPAWLLAWWLWFRRHRAGASRIGGAIALLLPAMMLVRALPETLQIVRTFDVSRHVLTPDVAAAGGIVRAAVAPLRLLDLANLALVLAPLAPLALAAAWRRSAGEPRPVELTLLAALGLASLPLVLLVHPQQGIFRDWDVFAPCGAALCMASALVVGATIRDRETGWLAAPALASAAIPTLLVLGLNHDLGRGMQHARAFAVEPPVRPAREQAFIWDYLGSRAFRLGKWDLAAEALEQCERFEPTRRVRLTWAFAETMRGDYASAAKVYRAILAQDPGDPLAWLGLGGAAKRMGDKITFARAAARIDSAMHVERDAREIRTYLSRYPDAWPVESGAP